MRSHRTQPTCAPRRAEAREPGSGFLLGIAERAPPVTPPHHHCHVAEVEGEPFGAKGVGGFPVIHPPAVLANAVYRTAGVRIRDLPLTAEKVLRALKGAGGVSRP
jgi:hypothetical protein